MQKGTSALVVLSGGQDSTTCLAWAAQRFETLYAVSFDYGQKHNVELSAARQVASMFGVVRHFIENTNVVASSSPLTNTKTQLELYSDANAMDETIGTRVEKTFVPLRNMGFLFRAAQIALENDCRDIVTGVCQADNANYPDCRQSFVTATQCAINYALGTDRGDQGADFVIHTPLMFLSKAESIALAQTLPGAMDALAYSHTCYAGEVPPCGKCHACVLRADGFAKAGVVDPLIARTAR
jgi:7-cyano-7-deazaguanine synthase